MSSAASSNSWTSTGPSRERSKKERIVPSGLTVADNLAELWRSFSLEYELFRSVIGWVPRIASYDVKCVLVEHLHEDMRRTRALRERIGDFGVFTPERQ